MRVLLGWLLTIHLFLSGAVILTMGLDFQVAGFGEARDALIDGYEAIGFGMLFVGIGLVGAVLALLWWRWPARD